VLDCEVDDELGWTVDKDDAETKAMGLLYMPVPKGR
jgi:hypothetical protein